jgi:S1-C subfamily serine protease
VAQVREGDVIVGFAGYPVETIDDLQRLLTDDRLDQRVPVDLVRRDERLEVIVEPRENR